MWSGPSLKREYELILGDKFNVEYAYIINDFLNNKIYSNIKKYKILKQILDENNINIFHSNDKNLYKNIIDWINNKIHYSKQIRTK